MSIISKCINDADRKVKILWILHNGQGWSAHMKTNLSLLQILKRIFQSTTWQPWNAKQSIPAHVLQNEEKLIDKVDFFFQMEVGPLVVQSYRPTRAGHLVVQSPPLRSSLPACQRSWLGSREDCQSLPLRLARQPAHCWRTCMIKSKTQ